MGCPSPGGARSSAEQAARIQCPGIQAGRLPPARRAPIPGFPHACTDTRPSPSPPRTPAHTWRCRLQPHRPASTPAPPARPAVRYHSAQTLQVTALASPSPGRTREARRLQFAGTGSHPRLHPHQPWLRAFSPRLTPAEPCGAPRRPRVGGGRGCAAGYRTAGGPRLQSRRGGVGARGLPRRGASRPHREGGRRPGREDAGRRPRKPRRARCPQPAMRSAPAPPSECAEPAKPG